MNSTPTPRVAPCITVDCRMLGMSGIGVYLENLVPDVVRRLPQYRFRLLGDAARIAALPLPVGESEATERMPAMEIRPCPAPIYSVQEQVLVPLAARGTDLLWAPHYNIPLCTTAPLLVTVHDVAHLVLPEVTRSLARHSYARLLFAGVRRKAHTILCVSQFTADEFVRLVGRPRGKMRVVHNGVDAAWFADSESHRGAEGCEGAGQERAQKGGKSFTEADTPYFIAVGNLKAHKRMDLLCRAFASVQDKMPHHLLLVGKQDGFISGGQSVAELMALAPGRIRCTGSMDMPHLREAVRGATALVFPSSYEGFGLPPLEAMAAQVPVIAADIPPVREVCGEWATYFPMDDQDALATALVNAATPTSSSMPDRAGARVHAARFTWHAAGEAVAQEMERLCGGSAGAAALAGAKGTMDTAR